MIRYLCCYTVVSYHTDGTVNGVWSDCFTLRAKSQQDAEEKTRAVAVRMNPDRRVHVVICKEM